ncbi:MAG: hypothetical protein ACM3L6_05450 [Deltaproteobacteria bacterium]
MTFFLIGIDHRGTPLEARERAYRRRADIAAYGHACAGVRTAVLSTCNRLEVYGEARGDAEAQAWRAGFLREFGEAFAASYVVPGAEGVFAHGVHLACGLMSWLPGEPQIHAQLGRWARTAGLPAGLAALWRRILERAEAVRSAAEPFGPPATLADVVFDDLERRHRPFVLRRILVIGTGKVAELMASACPAGVRMTFVARKNAPRAQGFAAGAEVVPPAEIAARLDGVDAAISATGSPHTVLRAEHVDGLGRPRPRPLWIYDLAMPRDVAPEVGRSAGVHVVDMEAALSGFLQRRPQAGRYVSVLQRWAAAAIRRRENLREDTSWNAAQPLGARAGAGDRGAVAAVSL